MLGLVHDEGMAEDLISEVFLDVWRQADRFEGRSAVSTWRDLRHSRRADGAGMRNWTTKLRQPSPTRRMIRPPRWRRRIESELLRHALTKLSAEHREIIDLVYYHEQSVDEAAQVLGIRAATVKTRMFYARKKLAEWIKAAEKSLGMGLRLLSA